MRAEHRVAKRGQAGLIGLVVLIIVIAALAALLVWKWDTIVERISENAVLTERRAWMKRTRELEDIIDQMQQPGEAKWLLPAERLSQAFGSDSPLVKGASPATMTCKELEKSLRAFCIYLDGSDTWRSHKMEQSCWDFLSETLAIAEQRLPTITQESYRPDIIIENSFYFFRLLRQKRMDVLRDLFKYEADLAEPLMGILYHWLLAGRQCDKTPPSEPALKLMYRYAGFFLNTLGGHSYLCRRDSRIGLLTLYYATLVIHQANIQKLNELGVDLRFFLPLLFNEIQSRNDLLYSEEYLHNLSNLQLNYFRQG
jgi:hypothetical protein